jgi:hypothetical protein
MTPDGPAIKRGVTTVSAGSAYWRRRLNLLILLSVLSPVILFDILDVRLAKMQNLRYLPDSQNPLF